MKHIIAWVVIILAGLSIIFGAIKPYKKASAYVSAVKSNPQSIQGFQKEFGRALEYPSPVGQDEMIRFISNDIMGVISGGKNDAPVVDALTDFIHTYADPKIEEGVGLNYTQLVMMLGNIHLSRWKLYENQNDFEKALSYFTQGYQINPDRPQFLFGLLELYTASGNREKAAQVENRIKELWGD